MTDSQINKLRCGRHIWEATGSLLLFVSTLSLRADPLGFDTGFDTLRYSTQAATQPALPHFFKLTWSPGEIRYSPRGGYEGRWVAATLTLWCQYCR